MSCLIKENSFSDTIFLLLTGRKPKISESNLFEKMLVSIIDHGMGTTSSLTARFIASGGNSMNCAVGGGILSIGDYHGGAIEKAMRQFYAWNELKNPGEEIKNIVENKKTIFGFGHRIYKEGDPRVKVLLEEIEHIQFKSVFLHFMNIIENSFKEIKSKNIFINIDGLIAILLCDFGFDPLLGKGIFIIGRTPGLVTQCYEELKFEKPVRRASEAEIKYILK